MSAVTLTPKAVEKVKEAISALIQQGKEVKGLRVGLRGGGCSGFQYVLNMELTDPNPQSDEVLEFEGLRVFIDRKSLLYLDSTTIDYLESLEKSGFTFNNPNAQRTCGCGESFSV